jgi:RNA polymerase sigma factor (sigma-70 family)
VDEVGDLVKAAAAGDGDAWAALVDRFANLVWAVARSAGLSAPDAADVSQTTWLRFCEHLGRLQDPSRAGSWLATTARREAVRVSKLGSRQVVADPWSFLEQPEANTEEAGARLMDKERDMTVQYALAVMPERCRALLLATTEDPPVPYETLAEHLGLAPGSIGPTRRRCLDQMRDLIEALAPELVEGAERPSVRL